MDARRGLFVVLGFLLALTFVNALTPDEDPDRAVKPPPQAGTPAPAADVTGILPREGTVYARVGDVVHIQVEAGETDTVEIVDLGVRAQAFTDMPAEIEFVADRPGRFPVTLRTDGSRVGAVKVVEAR